MTPIKFEGHNVVFAEDQPEYQPLPALRYPQDFCGTVITCWQLDAEELEEVKRTGKIYLSQMTFNTPLQPVLMSPDLSILVEARENFKKP
jgi:hypothetical protein